MLLSEQLVNYLYRTGEVQHLHPKFLWATFSHFLWEFTTNWSRDLACDLHLHISAHILLVVIVNQMVMEVLHVLWNDDCRCVYEGREESLTCIDYWRLWDGMWALTNMTWGVMHSMRNNVVRCWNTLVIRVILRWSSLGENNGDWCAYEWWEEAIIPRDLHCTRRSLEAVAEHVHIQCYKKGAESIMTAPVTTTWNKIAPFLPPRSSCRFGTKWWALGVIGLALHKHWHTLWTDTAHTHQQNTTLGNW